MRVSRKIDIQQAYLLRAAYIAHEIFIIVGAQKDPAPQIRQTEGRCPIAPESRTD
jgi:hypothetical protein